MLDKIRAHLKRLNASEMQVADDPDFEPKAGRLLHVSLEEAYWHLPPQEFLELLKRLPDGVGATEIHRALESQVTAVWHGPAPEESRDTPL
jgi:hypothetical protein